jgi:hypothetical protein
LNQTIRVICLQKKNAKPLYSFPLFENYTNTTMDKKRRSADGMQLTPSSSYNDCEKQKKKKKKKNKIGRRQSTTSWMPKWTSCVVRF